MHLCDLLKAYDINFDVERQRIETLFERTPCGESFGSYDYDSLKEYLANPFLNSKLRKTFICIDDFVSHFSWRWATPSMDGLLFYCEVIINLLCVEKRSYGDVQDLINRIVENISIIMERTGHELRKEEEGMFSIVKKDALAINAIEDIDDKSAAKAILEYNRLDMKGDLAGKKKLLKQIGDFLEPTLQTRDQLTGKADELADDVAFCLNNLDIRHNNKEGRHAKPFLATLPDNELEELYDDAYRSALVLIELQRQEKSHKRIAAARQKCKGTQ